MQRWRALVLPPRAASSLLHVPDRARHCGCTSISASTRSMRVLASTIALSASSPLGSLKRAVGLVTASRASRRMLQTEVASGLPPISRNWTPTSKRCGALGMKCGMTHEWTKWGEWVPLTVIEIQDVQVVQQKVPERDGFYALKLGGGWQKRKRLTKADARQYEKVGMPLKRYMREFDVSEDALLPIGTSINARHFAAGQFVDVQGVTKGKGFQGVMKRWGFSGQPASHGASLSHRSPGSSGGAAGSMYATRVFPGKKMPGKMGNKRRTAMNLFVYKVDPQHNLLYIKGSVPGNRGAIVRLKDAARMALPGDSARKPRQRHLAEPPFPTFLATDPGDKTLEPLIAPAADTDPLMPKQ